MKTLKKIEQEYVVFFDDQEMFVGTKSECDKYLSTKIEVLAMTYKNGVRRKSMTPDVCYIVKDGYIIFEGTHDECLAFDKKKKK